MSPDVVNTHTSKAGLIGRLAVLSLGRGRPALVHTFHGHVFYGYFSEMKVFLFLNIEKITFRPYVFTLMKWWNHPRTQLYWQPMITP